MAEFVKSEQRIELEALTSGTITEAVGGAGAVVLTILGLLHVMPVYLLAIAAIAAGAGLLFQGTAIAAEYSGLISHAGGNQLHSMNLGGDLGIEITAGAAAVALGILSLLGLVPSILLPISAIVLGCGVAFSSTTISRLNRLKIITSGVENNIQHIAGGAVDAASGMQIFVGLGAVTLGILSVIGVSPIVLTLIAILALGFSILISGLSISGRAFRTLERGY